MLEIYVESETFYKTLQANVKSQYQYKVFIKNILHSIWDGFLIFIIQFFADKKNFHSKLCFL